MTSVSTGRPLGLRRPRQQGAICHAIPSGIAGICDATRRIVGMMPHPERLFEQALGGSDGRGVLDSMTEAVDTATAN